MTKKKCPELIALLECMKNMNSKEIEAVIGALKEDKIDDICECVYNVIRTPLKISNDKRKKLKHYLKKHSSKKRLDIISKKSIPVQKRRKALQQEGKGLGMILATALPFLVDLFSPKK